MGLQLVGKRAGLAGKHHPLLVLQCLFQQECASGQLHRSCHQMRFNARERTPFDPVSVLLIEIHPAQ